MIKISFLILRDNFKLHLSKAYFLIGIKSDDIEQIKYIILGLKSYNGYIKKQLKLEITNLDRVISQIPFLSSLNRKIFINSFYGSLG